MFFQQFAPTATLIIAIAQLLVAIVWFIADRRTTLSLTAVGVLLITSLVNLIDAAFVFFPGTPEVWATLYALIAPALPFTYAAFLFTLARPDWMRGGKFLSRLTLLGFVVLVGLAAIDIMTHAGQYYIALPNFAFPQDYIVNGTAKNAVIAFVFGSIFFPYVVLGTALLLRWNRPQRGLQWYMLGISLVTLGVSVTIDRILTGNSTTLFANFVLSVGLFGVMLSTVTRLTERLSTLGRDNPIGTKLQWGYGALIIIMLGIAVLSSLSLYQLNLQVQTDLLAKNQQAQEATNLENAFRTARRFEREYALLARSTGLKAAQGTPYEQWLASMEGINAALVNLQAQLSDPVLRERVRVIGQNYDLYYQKTEDYYQGYIARGDSESGSLYDWVQSAQVLDELLDSNTVANREFDAQFVQLRNSQFYYLTTQDSAIGDDIRTQYDALQSYLLFDEIETPLALRTEIQVQLQEEALAFDRVRQSTRDIQVLNNSLEGAASSLENNIGILSNTISGEFAQGVVTLDRQRVFYVILIVAASGIALAVAMILVRIITRQITTPAAALAVAANRMAGGERGVRASVMSRDELGIAADAFNQMASSLDDLLNSLSQRVQQRTAQLETAAQVAEEAAGSMQELQSLLDLTTALIIERFPNIYHAQVFLIDQQGEGDMAVLRASTGEAGKRLLARQHRLGVGSQSVIGRVTSEGEYVLARADDPDTVHRPNDLLPDTKAELALPMRRGERIIGALDVQSLVPDAFGEDDIQVLLILANQLTVAVENARLFRDANLSLRETSRLFTASARIATAQNRDEVLDIFSDIGEELNQFDRLTVMFFTESDSDGNPMIAQSARTWSRSDGVMNTRNTYNITSVLDDLQEAADAGILELENVDHYEKASPELQNAFGAFGTERALIVPLRAAGNYLGMVLIQRSEVSEFPTDVKRMFQLLGQQAAIALNRFVLLDELLISVDDLRKIRESFLDISSATTLDRLYTQLAPRTASLMRSVASAIYIYDETEDAMRLVAHHGLDNRYLGETLRSGEGAAGMLIERREAFTIPNYGNYRQPRGHFGERYGPTVAAPLIWQEQLLGAIVAINHRDQSPFNPDDRDRIVLFGDQAALAIQNTRLLESSNRSLKEQRRLYQSTQALLGAGREEELVSAVASNLSEGNQEVVVVLKGVEQPHPALVVSGLNDAQWEANTFPKAQYRYASDLFSVGMQVPARLFVPEGAQIWEMTPQRQALADINHEMAQNWSHLHGFQYSMVVPIFTREGFWGAILLLRRDPLPYRLEDETRVTTVATQFAVAVDNIRLLAESQHAAQLLTTAAEVSRAASSQLDVEEVLSRAVNLVRDRFGHYHVQVFLVDEHDEWANLYASTGEVGAQLLAQQHRLAVGSQSVIGNVTSNGQYVLARSADVEGNTVHRFNELLPETRTELALPMMVGERVIGALDVQSVNADAFSDGADIDILQTLADQLSVAVDNARLYQETQETAEDNRALYNASRAINDSRDDDDIARAIQTYVIQDPNATVSLVKLSADANGLIREAEVEGDSRLKVPGQRTRRRFNDLTLPILRKLDFNRDVVVVDDLQQSERLSNEEKRLFRLLQMQALISVPLRLPGGWTGMILVTFPNARVFDERDINRLSNIATQTATTLQNRDLLEATAQSLEESRRMFEASAAINTATSNRALLEATLPLAQELQPAQVVMMLFDEAQYEGARPIRMRVVEGLTLRRETFPVGSNLLVRDLPLFRNVPVNITVALEDVGEADHLNDREREAVRRLGLRSLLYLPLQVGNRYLGYIGFNMTEPQRLRDSLIQRLQTVAQQAAIALQTQQYYGQAQRRAWREEQISRITSALNNATDPQEVLRIGIQELKDTLNVRQAAGWVEPAASTRVATSESLDSNGYGTNGRSTNGNGHGKE